MPPQEKLPAPELQISAAEPAPRQKKNRLSSLLHRREARSRTPDSGLLSDSEYNDDSHSNHSGDSNSSMKPLEHIGKSLKHLMHHHHHADNHNDIPQLPDKYQICQDYKSAMDTSDMDGDNGCFAKGTTAAIRLIKDPETGRIYAIKDFKKKSLFESKEKRVQEFKEEVLISELVRGSPNVVEVIAAGLNRKNHMCIVMEYCSKGDLFHVLNTSKLSPVGIDCLFKQLLFGLRHIHACGVGHRDIKPENLVLTEEGILKITDFGSASKCKIDEKGAPYWQGWIGSRELWSPEIWKIDRPETRYNAYKVDIWAAAITYYILRYGGPPFCYSFGSPIPRKATPPEKGTPAGEATTMEGDELYAHYISQLRGNKSLSADIWKGPKDNNGENLDPLGSKEQECLAGMLDPNPEHRWTIERVLACDWVKNIEICLDNNPHEHVQ